MSMEIELKTLRVALDKLSTHWFKRWFLPSGLLKAIKSFSANYPQSTPEICDAFEKTWFFQRWFSCLAAFNKSFTMDGYRLIKGVHLQKKFNGKVLPLGTLLHNTVEALKTLSDSGLLDGKQGRLNRQTLIDHRESMGVLKFLSDRDLLKGKRAQENFDAITQHPDQVIIERIFRRW